MGKSPDREGIDPEGPYRGINNRITGRRFSSRPSKTPPPGKQRSTLPQVWSCKNDFYSGLDWTILHDHTYGSVDHTCGPIK